MPALVAHTCITCGTQFAPSEEPPERCPICLDERQYVGHDGQRWTTSEELARTHRNRIEELEPGLIGIGVEPEFAIGQRALVVERLVWDCVSLLSEAAAGRIAPAGGIDAIAISHPHFYTAMVEWAERLDARVLLHEADREWIMRPSPRIELWSGERLAVSDGLSLIGSVGTSRAGRCACGRRARAGAARCSRATSRRSSRIATGSASCGAIRT
jgi:hypothetical protein